MCKVELRSPKVTKRADWKFFWQCRGSARGGFSQSRSEEEGVLLLEKLVVLEELEFIITHYKFIIAHLIIGNKLDNLR